MTHYKCSGIYGLGVLDLSVFLKEIYKTHKPNTVALVSSRANLDKAKVLLFNSVATLKQLISLIKPTHIIVVSDTPVNLRSIEGLIAIDYDGGAVSTFQLKPLKKVVEKPNRAFTFIKVDVIKEAVEKQSGSDFVTAYIQLISHAPDKHKTTLKELLKSFFHQKEDLQKTLEGLRSLFPVTANFMATRFLYKLEEEGVAYRDAILSDLPDDKAAEKFKLEQYPIAYFRRLK